MIRSWLFLMLALFIRLNASAAQPLPVTESKLIINANAGQLIGLLQNALLKEVSGMVAASDGSGHLWLLNDGGNGAFIYRVNTQGQIIHSFKIAKTHNRDWEDLAIFKWKQQTFLLIADVGDNRADRGFIELVVIAEPTLPKTSVVPQVKNEQKKLKTPPNNMPLSAAKTKQIQILPWQVQRYHYPQGPRDCEAITVDVEAGKVYLLTKRKQPAQLYSLSLEQLMRKSVQRTHVLILETELPSLSKPVTSAKIDSLFQFFANWPTAMSIDASQQRAAILTYGFLYFYQRQAKESWPQAFQKPFAVQVLSQLSQPEAVAFVGSDQVWVVSEQVGSPILSWQFPSR